MPETREGPRIGIRPGRALLLCLGALAPVVLGLLLLLPAGGVGCITLAGLALLAVLAGIDALRALRRWRRAPLTLTRRLPAAFAIGVTVRVDLVLSAQESGWAAVDLHDGADPELATGGLPLPGLAVAPGTALALSYAVTPRSRGEVVFAPAQLRVRSPLGLVELLVRAGAREMRRVYPDFAQLARYAWLAGDQRLTQIGIKTWQRRGEGTDFKQLAEYRLGHAVRHIDWKATLRHDKPIIREYQDERDQNVILMIDCGRRMRADERDGGIGRTHFDQVLNAALLLAYVALRHGDAVGAMTFGTPGGAGRLLRPVKGGTALAALMSALYDAQPTLAHSDYLAAARALMSQHTRRSLVIILTNFRDEDSTELQHALKLLRTRHLVLLASLRERIVEELIAQPLDTTESLVTVAGAHLFARARREAFRRLAASDSLMLDAHAEELATALVNHYQAVKRAGLL